MSPIDHLDVAAAPERSLAFCRGLLEPLGDGRVSEIAGKRGARIRRLAPPRERIERERG